MQKASLGAKRIFIQNQIVKLRQLKAYFSKIRLGRIKGYVALFLLLEKKGCFGILFCLCLLWLLPAVAD
jgi:predicted house-cleaning NTP pyrophosphatase (Maf/HAM1 superfamily)